MDLADLVRTCATNAGNTLLDRARGAFRLTVVPLHDLPGCLAFVIYEARPHGWWPLVAGKVTRENALVVTSGDQHGADSLPQLLEYLLVDTLPPTWTQPASTSSPI